MNRLILAVSFWLAWGGHLPAAEPSAEVGRPLLRFYTPGELLMAFDSPRVAQLPDDNIVVANGVHLVRFDGVTWEQFVLPSRSAGVRGLAPSDDGRMYAAGPGVIGYLERSAVGWGYVSLEAHLPQVGADADAAADLANVDELRGVAAVGDTVYFADGEKILRWREGTFTVIPYARPAPDGRAELHRVGEEVFVTIPGQGLAQVAGEALRAVADAPVLRDQRVVTLVAGAKPDTLLGLTAEQGFWVIDRATGTVAPWPTPMNARLAGKRVFSARRLRGGEWVVAFSATSGNGGLRFEADGRYAGPLDTSIGMAVSDVRGFAEDSEGGLWLGLDTGSARLVWPSAMSIFDGTNGLGHGRVTAVERHDGVLHAVTSEGVFRLEPGDGVRTVATFKRLTSLVPEAAGATSATVTAEGPSGRWEADARGIRLLSPPDAGGSGSGTGTGGRRLPHVLAGTVGAVAQLWEEQREGVSVLWVAGARGLARVEVPRVFNAPIVPLRLQLETIGIEAGATLPSRPPPLLFSFVAPRQVHTAAVEYQTRLVGWERGWSSWSPVRERSFPQLPAGRFRFEVRARDADRIESETVVFPFRVRPVWWWSGWMIGGYTLIGIALMLALVRWRTAALHRRAGELEQIVAARTADLARANAELVRLNGLELDEKITARLAEEKARLETLRYQLNPHFLFNSLASISAALPEDEGPARKMLERLADFCRLTLHRGDDEEWTTVGGEMRLLRAYLEIEQLRWGDLLDVDMECPPELESEALPYFLLLPLVENGLKYGRATSPERVGLVVRVRRGGDGGLVLEVGNTGTWIEPARRKSVVSLGIGLDNLRQRLARHYAGRHRTEIAPTGGWVWVALSLAPKHRV